MSGGANTIPWPERVDNVGQLLTALRAGFQLHSRPGNSLGNSRFVLVHGETEAPPNVLSVGVCVAAARRGLVVHAGDLPSGAKVWKLKGT